MYYIASSTTQRTRDKFKCWLAKVCKLAIIYDGKFSSKSPVCFANFSTFKMKIKHRETGYRVNKLSLLSLYHITESMTSSFFIYKSGYPMNLNKYFDKVIKENLCIIAPSRYSLKTGVQFYLLRLPSLKVFKGVVLDL